MTNNKYSLSIIIPVLNEEKSLDILYKKLKNVLTHFNKSYEIVFINDGSNDQSLKILLSIAKKDKRVKILDFIKNYGQTAAITAGIHNSSGQIIIFMDADLQNDPTDIPKLIRKINVGYDVVSGWRKKRQDPFFTKIFPSIVANKILSKVIGFDLHDYGCTLKAYRRNILERFNLYGEMHRIIPAYAAFTGAKIIEIPVNHSKRKYGKSHYGLLRILHFSFDLLTIKFINDFSTKPLYLFGSIGFFVFFLSIVLFALVTIRVIFFQGAWVSPMILMSGLMIILSFQFILIGLLAEIMVRTYFESQKKLPYIIRKSINL